VVGLSVLGTWALMRAAISTRLMLATTIRPSTDSGSRYGETLVSPYRVAIMCSSSRAVFDVFVVVWGSAEYPLWTLGAGCP
jgi:hypothetical protein